jgi:hypothetical protein
VQVGRVIHAHRHQRRVERHRGEAAGRHAGRRPIRVADGEDGDAGGEVAEQLPEARGVDGGLSQKIILARNSGLSTRRAGTKSAVTPMRVSAIPARLPSRSTAWSNSLGNSMP